MQACSTAQSLRKRIVNAKQTVGSGKFWLEKATSVDCDVVIQFPKEASSIIVQWLHQKIKGSEYEVTAHMLSHSTTKTYYVLCTTSVNSLLQAAEHVNLKKRLKPEFGGLLKDFSMEDLSLYEGIDANNTSGFFTSQERQHLTLYILNNIRMTKNELIQDCTFVEGQAILPRMLTEKLVSQIYPLHNEENLTVLRNDWVFDFTARQPLDAIKDYFGVHIGMYFAFLGHYTVSLILPAVLGVFIWLYSGTDQATDDLYFVIFALFNVIWSTIYIELWKRKEAEYAFTWGTLDKQDDLIEEPRPMYWGDLDTSAVTGRLEPHYPKWKRNLFFYTVSVPVMTVCHCFIVLVCFNFFTFYDYISDGIKAGSIYFFFKPVPNFCLAIAVMTMDKAYQRIATWLNDRENYRNEEEYKNNLIIKLMVFQSANSFLSLFYTAFYLQDFNRLRNQLAMLFIVRQVLGNMKESLLSFFLAKVKQYNGAGGTNTYIFSTPINEHPPSAPEKKDEEKSTNPQENKKTGLNQAESEGLLPKYDGTFEDYLEMVIQFGYLTWFSSVFPLAGLFALLNNIVEIRSDAFKICMSFQRPFGELVRNIGAWQTVLEVMSVGTIIVNTALIGMSGPMQRIFPDLSSAQRILLIVVLEHFVIALKFVIRMAISDVPEWVSVEMAKLEFHRREALKLKMQECFLKLKQSEGLKQEMSNTTRLKLRIDPSPDVLETHSTPSHPSHHGSPRSHSREPSPMKSNTESNIKPNVDNPEQSESSRLDTDTHEDTETVMSVELDLAESELSTPENT